MSKNLKKDQPSMARSMVNLLSPRKSSLIMLLKSLNLPRRSLKRLTTTTLMMTIQTMVKISSKMTIIKVIKGDTLIIRILTTKGISNTTKMRILNNQEGVVLSFTDVNITKIRTRMMKSLNKDLDAPESSTLSTRSITIVKDLMIKKKSSNLLCMREPSTMSRMPTTVSLESKKQRKMTSPLKSYVPKENLIMMMKTLINMTALMKSKETKESSRERIKRGVLLREKLNVSNKMIKRMNQLMRMKMIKPVRLSRNKILILLRSTLRFINQIKNLSKDLRMNNLDQNLREMITVMLRVTMRNNAKRKNAPLKRQRKSRKVLMISREPPCKHSRSPLMSGLEIYMDVSHQSK